MLTSKYTQKNKFTLFVSSQLYNNEACDMIPILTRNCILTAYRVSLKSEFQNQDPQLYFQAFGTENELGSFP